MDKVPQDNRYRCELGTAYSCLSCKREFVLIHSGICLDVLILAASGADCSAYTDLP